MAPPRLSDEQVNCGPFFEDLEVGGRVVSLETPYGKYDLAKVAAQLPSDQQPDVVVCLVDASWHNLPTNLGAFKCPKVALVADTHHMTNPVTGMIGYLTAERFDRVVFVYTRHHVELFRGAGIKNLFWLPSITFPHSDAVVRAVRRAERHNRIALIGQAGSLHERRLHLSGALAARGLPLMLREGSQREALEFYGSSLVGFNATANADLNLRAFEILGGGALMLMDRLAPESGVSALWREGREYVAYESAAELVERATHFIAHPTEARAIGEAGARWFDEHFNEARRQREFRSVVFDGKQSAPFELPHRSPASSVLFNGSHRVLAGALFVYEDLQKLHSAGKSVRVLVDEGVSTAFDQLCATLPRIEIVRKFARSERADCLVTNVPQAEAQRVLSAPRIWYWNARSADIQRLGPCMRTAGYESPHADMGYFVQRAPEGASTGKLVASAKAQLTQCNYPAALEKAQLALSADPKNAEACLIIAELAWEKEKADLFAKMIARAKTCDPEHPRIPLLELAARQTELRQSPVERMLTGATRRIRRDNLSDIHVLALRAQHLAPDLPATSYWLGRVRLRLANELPEGTRETELAGALSLLQRAVESSPTRLEFRMEYARALHHAGRIREAIAILETCVQQDASDPLKWYMLAVWWNEISEAGHAAGVVEQGLVHCPENRPLLRLRHSFCQRAAAELEPVVVN